MTSGTIQHDETASRKECSGLGARLGAVVDLAARLGHTYKSVEFDSPCVLRSEQILSRDTVKWSSSTGAAVWLGVSSRALTIGAELRPSSPAGRLIFWAILDPENTENSFTGLMVGRAHATTAVGKVTRIGKPTFASRVLCVLATGDLISVADSDLLSLIAKGFSEAASDHDRDAWVSWLWNHVSQGHLTAAYVKKLGTKILAPHARKTCVSTVNADSMELTKLLKSVGVFERQADYILPSGLHAAVHVNLGAACGNNVIVRQLARRVKELLDDSDYDTIVSTGWPAAVIAREVIRLRPMTRLGIVRHCQYEGLPPRAVTPVIGGSRAVILTDVVLTGRLVGELSDILEHSHATVSDVIAIVDPRYNKVSVPRARFRTLCQYDIRAVPAQSCPRCGRLESREFNPVACCMTKKAPPRSPGQFLEKNKEAADFWRQVDLAQAYEHHRIEGHTHYVSFINTERLLGHETIGAVILNRIAARLPRLIGGPDVLLIPGKPRARALAKALLSVMAGGGRLWPPQVVAARQKDGRYQLTPNDAQSLRAAKVLFLDTGTSSGATLEEFHDLANCAGAGIFAAAVMISRLSESQEEAVSKRLNGRFWRLFQLPVRPLSIPDSFRNLCPICSRRAEIEAAASDSRLVPIIELSKEIRSRRGHRARVPSAGVGRSRDRQSRLIVQDEAPLLERCRRSTASGVTLHSLCAAQNNGMAPLRLPELCDAHIPAKNKTAMLEYLGSTTLQWSGDSLLPDAKRVLDQRDPDDVWAACVGLLNGSLIEKEPEDRASCSYWVKALQHRLETSDAARQQRSKAVWNRLAFEVYSLIRREPSYIPELGRRFESMLRACLRTPAEAQIMPIFQMIQEAKALPGSR